MKIYLVGGAVRDKLLGLPVMEKDWVVVGGTPDVMLKKGFRPVGKEFPVFLHPDTQEEYALARTERKVGRGYTGFHFNASPDVTLEDDLKRRDLTINAMAETPSGELIDPYHGKQDLEKKILRHVSSAFVEDPVRILRVARFASRFAEFNVAPETNALMKQMVKNEEVNALVAERVWKEMERALSEKNPERFFQVLADCDALPVLFPSLVNYSVLQKAAQQSDDAMIRFSALLHSLSEKEITDLCERYRIPSDYRALALLVSRYLPLVIQAKTLSPTELLNLFRSVDAFRREERFKKFLQVCEICASISTDFLLEIFNRIKNVDVKKLLDAGFSGKKLAEKIDEERIRMME